MTFKANLTKVHLLLILALLAALLVPVMGVAAGQSIAANELFNADTAESIHTDLNPGTAIACSCGDPGGGGSGCC